MFLHPVPLGYYILARFALRLGDRPTARIYLRRMEEFHENIPSSDAYHKSTKSLITVLTGIIALDN